MIRFLAEFILSVEPRSFVSLRMTSEGLRMRTIADSPIATQSLREGEGGPFVFFFCNVRVIYQTSPELSCKAGQVVLLFCHLFFDSPEIFFLEIAEPALEREVFF